VTDQFYRGPGDDLLDVVDGIGVDRVSCGPGRDKAIVNASQPTAACERVVRL
jgi:hypothetical protein